MAKRKYTKKSEYWDKPRTVGVEKAGNTDMAVSRLKLGEMGSTALGALKIYSRWVKPYDLAWPQCINTYREMSIDEDVSTALDANFLFVERAFDDFTVTFNKKSKASEDAADFVKWALRNMDNQTLREAVRSALTCKIYGFSILEKVYTQVKTGEYTGRYKIQKLSSRPQETLDPLNPFVFSDDGREIVSVTQNLTKLYAGYGNQLPINIGKVDIPRNKVMIFSYSGTDTNPFGISPLESVYIPYKEKKLIADYEVVGVSKDLGGMPVLEVPSDILNRAADDPNSDEARSIDILKQNLANLHAGEQAYMIIPSDVQDQGNGVKQYAITFKGIEGSGKQFDTSALKAERKKVIYDRFGAAHLIMGGSGEAGSYALSDNKQTLHSQFIERDVKLFEEVLNKDLIPQFLALNGIKLTDADMPVFVAGEVGDPDIEGNSKMIQRVVAVGAVPLTPEVINEFMAMCGLKYQIPDDVMTDETKLQDFLTEYMKDSTSRSGDGLSSSSGGLNGTADAVSTSDTSTTNLDNAA